MKTATSALLAALLMMPPAVRAITVYKTVAPDGSVSYSDQPPAEGQRSATLEINEYPTGLSALDMRRLQEMRETTDRMREDRLQRERQRDRERARRDDPPYAAAPTAPPPNDRADGERYMLPAYYPRYPRYPHHPRWRPPYRYDDDTRPALIPNPNSASPRGLVQRIRRNGS
jgi:UDP:flavonoid glycosyltransferase YjiC (YdhE family)